jgi:tetratricopeptide (TPR) repeat protein
MDGDEIQSLLERANGLLESGNAAESLSLLNTLRNRELEDEDRIEFGCLRSWALSELGQHEEAIEIMEGLAEEFADSGRVRGTFGVVLSNAGELEDACEELETAVQIDDEDESSLANLGLVYERLRDYRLALETYEKAIEKGADIDWLLQRKAAVHAELGDLPTARTTLRRYLSLAPDDANEWVSLAILHSDDEEFDKAFECYRQAEQIAPDSTALRLNWGVTAVRARDVESARQQLRYLQRLEPSGARPILLEAFIAEESGDPDAVLACYNRALEAANPDDAGDVGYALEMAMDFSARQGLRERCDELFEVAYRLNCCSVELCEAYREVGGQECEEATWFSLMFEAEYRSGLAEIVERATPAETTMTRYARNMQIVARDRDEAMSIAGDLLRKMGEKNVGIREFVGEEPIKNVVPGIYEIEHDSVVFGTESMR